MARLLLCAAFACFAHAQFATALAVGEKDGKSPSIIDTDRVCRAARCPDGYGFATGCAFRGDCMPMDSARRCSEGGGVWCDARQQKSSCDEKTLCCPKPYGCMVPRGGGPKRCVGPADGQTDPVPCSAIATTAAPEHNCYTREVWSSEKKAWCCKHKGICTATTTAVPNHNCYTREVWSNEKKLWCCKHKGICPGNTDTCDEKSRCCPKPYSCMVPRGGGAKRCVGPADGQTKPVPCGDTPPGQCHAVLAWKYVVPNSSQGWFFESDDQSTAMDKWCEHNCNAPEPFCPSSHCECAPKPACTCPKIYRPVLCASDSKRYGNKCEASCAGATGCVEPPVCPLGSNCFAGVTGTRWFDGPTQWSLGTVPAYPIAAVVGSDKRVVLERRAAGAASRMTIDTEGQLVLDSNAVLELGPSACTAFEVEVASPTPTSDRVCRDKVQCRKGQEFEKTPPTATSSRICMPYRVCGADEYEVRAGSAYRDRECGRCDALPACASFEKRTGCGNGKRGRCGFDCSTGNCYIGKDDGRWFKSTASWSLDMFPAYPQGVGIERPVTVQLLGRARGAADDLYMRHDAEIFLGDEAELEIGPTVCDATEDRNAEPTSSKNTQCDERVKCTQTQFETAPHTPTSLRECQDHKKCRNCATAHLGCSGSFTAHGKGQFISRAAGTHHDRECGQLRMCDYDKEYEAKAPTATSNRVCLPLDTCDHDEYVHTEKTLTSDRICRTHKTCRSDQYETKAPTPTSDRECAKTRVCNCNAAAGIFSEYETVAPTRTSNRECAAMRTCAYPTAPHKAGEWEHTPPTCKSNRVCHSLTTCDYDEQYESLLATRTRNRVCTDLTKCVKGAQWQTVAPTKTSNRKCQDHRTCQLTYPAHGAGEWISVKAGDFNDRVCTPLTMCDYSKQWERSAPSKFADRDCQPLRICVHDEWQVSAPKKSANRVCSKCAELPACEHYEHRVGCGPLTGSGKCVFDCGAQFGNCYVGEDGGKWFASPSSWSKGSFPDWPQKVAVQDKSVKLRKRARGTSTMVFIGVTGELTIEPHGNLEIGATSCDASEYERTPPTWGPPTADRTCGPKVVCTSIQVELSPQTPEKSRVCGTCPGGYACDGGPVKVPCTPGHFAPIGAAACVPCGAENRYAGAVAATCSTCGAGSYTSGGSTNTRTTCTAYTGTCEHGTLIAQAQRTQDNHCGSCDDGYYLKGMKCHPYTGMCSHGKLASQTQRRQHDHCGSCNSGYFLKQRACHAYIGTCNDGTLIEQVKREQHDHCGSCNSGYYLESRQCKPYEGLCVQGDLIEQSRRRQHNHCGSCNSGYYLEQRACLAYGGSCPNGKLIAQSKRTQHDHCATCAVGFGLNDMTKACDGCKYLVTFSDTDDASPCKRLDVCTNGKNGTPSEYEKVPPARDTQTGNGVADRLCATHSPRCANVQLESAPATPTSDRACASCPAGKDCDGTATMASCGAGQFAAYGDGNCSACGSDSRFSGVAAAACSVCAAGSYTSGGTKTTRTTCTTCLAGNSCDGTSTITGCEAGHFAAAGASKCKPCNHDKLFSSALATKCDSCPSGSYTSGNDASTRTACSTCPSGYRCDGGHIRRRCPSGTFAKAGASMCTDCGADNTYSLAGASKCKVCTRGSFTSGGKSTNTRDACTTCVAGSKCDGTSIVKTCPQGTFSKKGAWTCLQCGADNQYAKPGQADKCLTCKAGSFTSGGTLRTRDTCSTCAAGSKCDGTNVMATCPAGTFSKAGASTCTNCGMDIKYSPAGQPDACRVCAPGSYTSGGTRWARTTCSTCTAGSKCDGGSKVTTCGAGTFSKVGASACTNCGADNKYSAAGKADSCLVCASGSYTSGGNSASRTSCATCKAGGKCDGGSKITTCSAGTFSKAGASSCTKCGADFKYSAAGQADSCRTCAAGSYTQGGTKSTRWTCSICSAGSSCDGTSIITRCTSGYYAPMGSDSCTACGADNKYSTARAGQCSTCAAGSFTSGGASSATRTTCASCPPGFSCNGSSEQTRCPAGYFAPGGAASCSECGHETKHSQAEASECETCAAGSFTSGGANHRTRTTCTGCPAGFSCDGSHRQTPCAAGTFSEAGQDSCKPCGADNMYSNAQAAACYACSAGSFTSGGKSSKKRTTCTICPAGHACDGTSTVQQCGADDHYAAAGSSTCNTCAAGSFTAGGTEKTRVTCTICAAAHECPGGSDQLPCAAGYYAGARGWAACKACGADNKYSAGKATGCSTCAAGSYTAGGDESTRHTCSICSEGHRCPGGSSEIPCLEAHYQDNAGHASCKKCEVGFYQPLQGQDFCDTCNLHCLKGHEHTFCGNATSGECVGCAPGQFKQAAGVHTCNECPAGRYQAARGKSHCHPCDGHDYYQDEPGKTSCKKTLVCKANQWETKAATVTSDRECTDHTVCRWPNTYPNTQFMTKEGGTHHDRECQEHRVCSHVEYETIAASYTSDRQCKLHTICNETSWAVRYEGTHHDRQCAMQQPCRHTKCRMHNGRVHVLHHKNDHELGFTHHRCRYFADVDRCRCLCHNAELDKATVMTKLWHPHKRFFWRKERKTVAVRVPVSGKACTGAQYSPQGKPHPSSGATLCRAKNLGQSLSVAGDGTPYTEGQASSIVVFKNDGISWMGADTKCTGFQWASKPVTMEVDTYTCVEDSCAHPNCCDCGNEQCNQGVAKDRCATKSCSTTSHVNFAPLSWTEAQSMCRDQRAGVELPSRSDLCHGGSPVVPTFTDDKKAWVPVSDHARGGRIGEYLYLGTDKSKLCKLHHELPGMEHAGEGGFGLPTWSNSVGAAAAKNKASTVYCRACSRSDEKAPRCPVPQCPAPPTGCSYVSVENPEHAKFLTLSHRLDNDEHGCPHKPCENLFCKELAQPDMSCFARRTITIGDVSLKQAASMCVRSGETFKSMGKYDESLGGHVMFCEKCVPTSYLK